MTDTTTSLRVAYLRANRSTGLYAQRMALEANGGTIDRWFEDVASGATNQRPGLDALRELTASGQVGEVLIKEPARLSRNALEGAALYEELSRRATVTYVNDAPCGMLPANARLVAAIFPQRAAGRRHLPTTRGWPHQRGTGGLTEPISHSSSLTRYESKRDLQDRNFLVFIDATMVFIDRIAFMCHNR